MSTRPAIIALLITLLLAIGAYLVLKPPGAGGGTAASIAKDERLFTLDPAAINSIILENPPAKPQRIERTGDGRWSWRSSAESTRRYALDDGMMRTILRKFGEAKGLVTPVNTKPLTDQPAPVTLTFVTAAGDTTLRLAPRALGGQVLADVKTPASATPRAAVVPDELLAVLTSPGPSAWRDTAALPPDAATAARITFTDGAGTKGFGLARRDGQWYLTPPAPVTAPADSEMVNEVLKTLDGLTVSRFFDDATQPTPQAAGLGGEGGQKPSAILTLEFDDRSIDPATQKPVLATRTVRLVIGQPADTAGTTLYATPDEGKTIFGVVAAPLAKLTTPASSLVMRSATRTLPADVGAIELTGVPGDKGAPPRALKLTRDGVTSRWTETLDATPPVTLDPAQAVAAESLLTFFTRTAADSVAFHVPPPPPAVATPPDTKHLASITLLSPGGQPLDRFALLAPSSGGGIIISSTGTTGSTAILRSYTKPPDELIRRLAVLAR